VVTPGGSRAQSPNSARNSSRDRNIIGDATGSGIVVQGGALPPLLIGAHDNQIVNNYIGVGWSVNADDYTNRGNGARGIHLLGHDNTISGFATNYDGICGDAGENDFVP